MKEYKILYSIYTIWGIMKSGMDVASFCKWLITKWFASDGGTVCKR